MSETHQSLAGAVPSGADDGAQLRVEIERAYQMLGANGVPCDRARNLANGIDVLVTRMARANDAEIERYKRWINDLQSGMYINCVYCGHRYGPSDKVPATMADVLKTHIEQCPEHPMSKLKRAGYVLAMEVLQSNLVLDDEATAARDLFIPTSAGKDGG